MENMAKCVCLVSYVLNMDLILTRLCLLLPTLSHDEIAMEFVWMSMYVCLCLCTHDCGKVRKEKREKIQTEV